MRLFVLLAVALVLCTCSDITIQEVDPDTNQPIGPPVTPSSHHHEHSAAPPQVNSFSDAKPQGASQQHLEPARTGGPVGTPGRPQANTGVWSTMNDLQRQLQETQRMFDWVFGNSNNNNNFFGGLGVNPLDNIRLGFPNALAPFSRPFGSLLAPSPSLAQLSKSTEIRPVVDIVERDTEYLFHVEVPGVRQEDIQIDLRGNTLVFSGKKTARRETGTPGSFYHSIESSSGMFRRAFTLPRGVDTEHIKANFQQNGIVDIHVPKREPSHSRKINLNLLNTQ